MTFLLWVYTSKDFALTQKCLHGSTTALWPKKDTFACFLGKGLSSGVLELDNQIRHKI